ncbi:MAG: hypothetical protein IKW19_00205 [Akkermansia sp.]|nr:hypothetical protein [Akkermansia sp.]
MSDILNTLSIPEQYRSTWQSSMIEAITQPSTHLSELSSTLENCTGEYVKMQTIGSATMARRKQRHEKIVADELKLGNRRVYPAAFGAALKMSQDDFTFKGGLPITLNTMHDALNKAAQPYPDRVFLGVQYDETLGNCVICPASDGSPYWNDASDGVNTDTHSGQPGGIMGTNFAGETGTLTLELPKHPYIGKANATAYSEYASDLSGLVLSLTNVLPVNYSETGTPADCGLTIEKLLAARMGLLMRHVINQNTEVCLAITPWQMMDLIKLDKLQNGLYGFQALKTGWFSSMLGIRFLVTVDVPIVNIGTEGEKKYVRACPMWVKDDVCFGVWDNPQFEMEKLSGYWDTILTTLQFAYGAGRKREESVIAIHCAEDGLRKLNA